MKFSPDGSLLAVYCRDSKVRIFQFRTGRLLTVLDESVAALTAQQEAEEPSELTLLEPTEFQAKMQSYKEVMRLWDSTDSSTLPSLAFDETGSTLAFASPIGIKIVDVS